jgi:hypothetical protein
MTPDGVEFTTFRQRRSATGDTFFTGRLGSAFVIMVRDQFEHDLWRMIACDPSQSDSGRSPAPARAIAPPADDHSFSELNDDIPEDVV